MEKLLFIVNPTAGHGTIQKDFFDIIDLFTKAGYRVEVHPTQNSDDCKGYILEEGHKYNRIVCAGGDGTLDQTVEGILELGDNHKDNLDIGYIPCGTTNDYARSLMISLRPLDAAKQILYGKTRLLDVGRFENDPYIYVAAFGVFTSVSYSTPQAAKNLIGHAAYVLEAFKEAANIAVHHMQITCDNRVVEGDFIYGQITNSLSVGGFRLMGTNHVIFDDGKFECVLIRKFDNLDQFNNLLTALAMGEIYEDLMVVERAARIKVVANDEVAWTTDGEYSGTYKECNIEVVPKKLPLVLDNDAKIMF